MFVASTRARWGATRLPALTTSSAQVPSAPVSLVAATSREASTTELIGDPRHAERGSRPVRVWFLLSPYAPGSVRALSRWEGVQPAAPTRLVGTPASTCPG